MGLAKDARLALLTVIAPCFNEQDNIRSLTTRVGQVFEGLDVQGELILINDASTDATKQRIEDMAAEHDWVVGLDHESNRGLFEGWLTGLNAASGTVVCLIDSDLQNPPEEIERLYRKLSSSAADMVQAVRSSIGRLKDSRLILSRGLNVLLNTVLRCRATDNKSGFVVAHREVLADVLNLRRRYYYPHTFIRVSAESKGYNVLEVETLFVDRVSGKSFLTAFPFRTIAAVLLDLLAGVAEFGLGRREDEIARFLRASPPQREPERIAGWRRAWMEVYFLTFPLHKWMLTRATRARYLALRRSQYLSREDLDRYRLYKLQRIVRHAYANTEFYRKRMDDLGVTPDDIQTLSDLCKLPMLSKEDVRKNLHFGMFASNHVKREMLRVATSGSTGEPFVIYADRAQLETRAATTLRAAEWAGWRFGDRQARLWHQTIGLSRGQAFKERLDAVFMRRLFVPAYEIREDNIKGLFERIARHRPVLLDGYAESFNFLALYARSHGIAGIRPRAIMSSAQILPAQTRSTLEDVFKTEVFDKYGSREFSGIAYEDSGHDGHLVMAESYIVEILKDGRTTEAGEVGEIVVTDLHNMHVPIIRYRIGDLAETLADSGTTASGSAFPRIGRIEGRTQAIVMCPDGTWLPGTFFAHYFKEHDQVIRHFQVIQENRAAITIKLVPALAYSEASLKAIVDGLRHYVSDEMRIDLELVEEIPLVRTGKRTGVVSRLNLDFQEMASDAPEDES